MSNDTLASKCIAEIKEHVDAIRRYTHTINRCLEKDYPPDTKISIQVPVQKIKESYNRYQLISCQGFVGAIKVDWLVACGSFSKLRSKLDELSGEINLLDYLPDLIPTASKIGFVTSQNGIQNTLKDFFRMGQSIINNFPERPLFIALYNPTEGIIRDIDRIAGHTHKEASAVVCRTRVMMSTFAQLLLRANPNLRWLHIAHSEGGAITHLAINSILSSALLSSKLPKGLLKDRLITAAYGPVLPVPKAFALKTYNIYSTEDYATKFWAEYFRNDPEYEIEFVESKVPKTSPPPIFGVSSYLINQLPYGEEFTRACFGFSNEIVKRLPPGDHGFQDATYQAALSENIKLIRRTYGISTKVF